MIDTASGLTAEEEAQFMQQRAAAACKTEVSEAFALEVTPSRSCVSDELHHHADALVLHLFGSEHRER